MAQVKDVSSESEYNSIVQSLQPGALTTIFFHTPWAAPCKTMRNFFDTLASQYQPSDKLAFLAIDAEELPEISETFDVTAVPFVVLVRDGKLLDSISGSNNARVRDSVEKEAGVNKANGQVPEKLNVSPHAQPLAEGTAAAGKTTGTNGTKNLSSYTSADGDAKTSPEHSGTKVDEGEEEDITEKLEGLVKAAPVMLFMKGRPSEPQCGFSRQLVAILRERSVRYGFFDILQDSVVREQLKIFADWPTYPQLWVGGELVGGLDIVREEISNNEDFFADYTVQGKNGVLGPDQSKTVEATAA